MGAALDLALGLHAAVAAGDVRAVPFADDVECSVDGEVVHGSAAARAAIAAVAGPFADAPAGTAVLAEGPGAVVLEHRFGDHLKVLHTVRVRDGCIVELHHQRLSPEHRTGSDA